MPKKSLFVRKHNGSDIGVAIKFFLPVKRKDGFYRTVEKLRGERIRYILDGGQMLAWPLDFLQQLILRLRLLQSNVKHIIMIFWL